MGIIEVEHGHSTFLDPVLAPGRHLVKSVRAERFVRSIKDECLNRMIFFGEQSLRKATREFAVHYHRERNHQGLDDRLIDPDSRDEPTVGPVLGQHGVRRDLSSNDLRGIARFNAPELGVGLQLRITVYKVSRRLSREKAPAWKLSRNSP